VRLIDAAGQPVAAWTHGTDPYPPCFFSTRRRASAPSPRLRGEGRGRGPRRELKR
jgi:hypothetical protein